MVSNDETVSLDGGARYLDGSESLAPVDTYDDDNGPAAQPVRYEGPAPTQPDKGTLGPVAMVPQPVLTDGGGLTVNAPKVPGISKVPAVMPSATAAPQPVLTDEVRVTRTVFDTRLVWLGLIFLVVMVAADAMQQQGPK
jgi:hypothetical protein